MKRILITGANSYIGTSFEKWMQQFGDDYQIDTIDMHGEAWRENDFSVYDSIFHVAGIAHADVSKVSEETKQLYYKVNCDLAVETAKKYKRDLDGKIGQFIYMSSIIIYGDGTSINKKRVITVETEPNPSNFYGDSKLKAEIGLQMIKNDYFKLVILRPPLIYGNENKGNYKSLEKIAEITPIFPRIKNEKSVLSINILCSYVKEVIDQKKEGIFFPQNPEYMVTSDEIKKIAESKGKKFYLVKGFSWLIIILGLFPGKIGKLTNKAFGNLVYEKEEKV